MKWRGVLVVYKNEPDQRARADPTMWDIKGAQARIMRLVRSGIAGLAATGADVGTLTVLVAVFHLTPRAASIPALLVGAVVNLIGNREYAFHAHGNAGRQVLGYAAVESVALGLNGLLFALVLHFVPASKKVFWLVRIVTSNVVFLVWSYPLWKRVFRSPGAKEETED